MSWAFKSLLTYPKLTTALLILPLPLIYYTRFERHLNSQVQLCHFAGDFQTEEIASTVRNSVHSIPESTLTSRSVVYCDRAVKHVPANQVPTHLPRDELLTQMNRYTMTLFSGLPHAYLLRLMVSDPVRKASFRPAVIAKLDFEPGDVVNGLFRVVHRQRGEGVQNIEFQMEEMEGVQGRLVFVVESTADEVVFTTITVTWREAGSSVVMPMERAVPRWIHSLVTRWTLVRGVEMVVGLRERR